MGYDTITLQGGTRTLLGTELGGSGPAVFRKVPVSASAAPEPETDPAATCLVLAGSSGPFLVIRRDAPLPPSAPPPRCTAEPVCRLCAKRKAARQWTPAPPASLTC